MSRPIPIIKLYGNLIVSIQIELSDQVIAILKEDISHEIRNNDVSGLIIEVSGVDVFDSYIARSVQDISQLAKLMGVETVLAGLDAGMAITLVEMGMLMEGVDTALSLEGALDKLEYRKHNSAKGQSNTIETSDLIGMVI